MVLRIVVFSVIFYIRQIAAISLTLSESYSSTSSSVTSVTNAGSTPTAFALPPCQPSTPPPPIGYPRVHKTSPAPGVKRPLKRIPVFSDVGGTGKPVDYLTGMSKEGWKLVQETRRMILDAAAKSANTSGDGVHLSYDQTRLYV